MEQPPPIPKTGPHPLVQVLAFAPLRGIFTGTPVPLEGYRSIPALKLALENHPWRKFWFIRSEDRLIIEPKPLLPFSLGGTYTEFVGEVMGEEERAVIRGRFVSPFLMKLIAVVLAGICLVVPHVNGISFGGLLISYFILLSFNFPCWLMGQFNDSHERLILEALQKSTVP